MPRAKRRAFKIVLAKREALHDIVRRPPFFVSDKPAEAQPAAQQEEEQRLAKHRQPRVLAKSQIPPVDVLLGAGAHAGFTGDALPAAQAAFLQLQAHRALLLAGIAARDAAVALSVQPRSGECIACEACVGTCPKRNIHRWDTALCKHLWLPVLGKALLFFLLGCWLGFCRFI